MCMWCVYEGLGPSTTHTTLSTPLNPSLLYTYMYISSRITTQVVYTCFLCAVELKLLPVLLLLDCECMYIRQTLWQLSQAPVILAPYKRAVDVWGQRHARKSGRLCGDGNLVLCYTGLSWIRDSRCDRRVGMSVHGVVISHTCTVWIQCLLSVYIPCVMAGSQADIDIMQIPTTECRFLSHSQDNRRIYIFDCEDFTRQMSSFSWRQETTKIYSQWRF